MHIWVCFNCTFFLCTEWNNAKDLSKQTAVNGVLEIAPADGSVTSRNQVMLIKTLNTLFLLSQVVFFNGVLTLVLKVYIIIVRGGRTQNKLLLHTSSGAYLNHHLISSVNVCNCMFQCFIIKILS